MPPASEPIREQILEDVLSTLRAVAAGPTYWYTLGTNNVRRVDAGVAIADRMESPALIVGLGDSFRVDGSSAGNEDAVMENVELGVAAWLGDSEDVAKKLARLETDIRHALYEDRTRSGLAFNTSWQGTTFIDPDMNEGRAIVRLDFLIEYEVMESDLTSTIPG